jgi:uncharacterized surface protein with fasciclin (FAS1) repeats
MRNFRQILLTTFLLVSVLLTGCMDSDDVGDAYKTFTGEMISDYLDKNADQFSEFTRLMVKANIYPLMKTYGKYTVFLPTNEAMFKFYKEKPLNPDTLSDKELKKLVFYHFIDGETNSSQTYSTTDFVVGSIPTKNMIGRYLYTNYSNQIWTINEEAKIVDADLEMLNGIVHIVNHVLEGNEDLLPDFIESNGRYKIYAEALHATELYDKMLLMDDETYVQPQTLPDGSVMSQRSKYPDSKKYGWTAMLESDSVLALNGIHSLNDLRNYAKEVYKGLNKTDVEDETNPLNSLNHFVAYHFLPAFVTTDNFVTEYGYVSEYNWFGRKDAICYDGKYTIEQYWPTMAPGTLIQCQKGNIINTVRNPFTEPGLPNSSDVIHFIASESNKDCSNGILHSLNKIMAYDADVENNVLHRRLRMELRTFLPELVTNDVIAYGNKYNQWHRYIPEGYCANLKFNEERPSVYLVYHAANVHHYLYGDELEGNGFFDVTFTVGPVPAGKYELRFGYHVSPSTRGITQIYFDGEPCGIPVDMRLTATAGDIGWQQDYDIIENYNGAKLASDAPYNKDDPFGYENDKSIRNRNFMKAPDSYVGTNWFNDYADIYGTARNSSYDLRYILGTYTFTGNTTHQLRFVQMLSGTCLFDYIEFMPVDLLDKEDQH